MTLTFTENVVIVGADLLVGGGAEISSSLTVGGDLTVAGSTVLNSFQIVGPGAAIVSASSYSSFNQLVAQVGSNRVNILIEKEFPVLANLTIPAEYSLHFMSTGYISIGTAVTLTLNTTELTAQQRAVFTFGLGAELALGTAWQEFSAEWVGGPQTYFEKVVPAEPTHITLIITRYGELNAIGTISGAFAFRESGFLVTIGVCEITFTRLEASEWQIFSPSAATRLHFTSGISIDASWFSDFDALLLAIGTDSSVITGNLIQIYTQGTVIPPTVTLSLEKGQRVGVHATADVTFAGAIVAYGTTITQGIDGGQVGTFTHTGSLVNLEQSYLSRSEFDAIFDGQYLDQGLIRINTDTIFENGYDPMGIIASLSSLGGDLTSVQGTANDALNLATDKALIFRQDTQPLVATQGDIWVYTGVIGLNRMYWFDGVSWQLSDNAQIATAISGASNAVSLAAAKSIISYGLSSVPPVYPAPEEGDMWYQTDTQLLMVWSPEEGPDGDWVEVKTGEQITKSSSAPTVKRDGLLWYDSTNKLTKRWDAGENAWDIVGDYTQTKIDGGVTTTGRLMVADGTTTVQAGMSGNSEEGTDVRIWAGATFEDKASAPFRVYEDGSLHSSLIQTLDQGEVANFSIDSINHRVQAIDEDGKIFFDLNLNTGNCVIGSPTGEHLTWDNATQKLGLYLDALSVRQLYTEEAIVYLTPDAPLTDSMGVDTVVTQDWSEYEILGIQVVVGAGVTKHIRFEFAIGGQWGTWGGAKLIFAAYAHRTSDNPDTQLYTRANPTALTYQSLSGVYEADLGEGTYYFKIMVNASSQAYIYAYSNIKVTVSPL